MANTIADKLERLEQTKQKLRGAISSKTGEDAGELFSAYPEKLTEMKVLDKSPVASYSDLQLRILGSASGSGFVPLSDIFVRVEVDSLVIEVYGSEITYSSSSGGGEAILNGTIRIPLR